MRDGVRLHAKNKTGIGTKIPPWCFDITRGDRLAYDN